MKPVPANEPDASKGASAASECRPVLFLDWDDVLCVNEPFGGYDAALALACDFTEGAPLRGSDDALWQRLFVGTACENLRKLDAEFRPHYVLSTSWWWLMDDSMLREVLFRTGLEFVVDNLHPDSATPKGSRPDVRWIEISNWLAAHPECSDRWVVLDDKLSGTGLVAGQPRERRPFIVLCTENVGLTEPEYVRLRAAFQLRSDCRTARSSICDDAK